MRTSSHIFSIVVAVATLHAMQANAQDSRVQWMTATSKALEGQAKIEEARAKIIAAQAAMVTAQANAWKTGAEAAQIREHTKGLSLDNQLKKATVYYEKRSMYANYKSLVQFKPPQPTRDDLIRYSAASAPKRLTKEQLDPNSGEISWPALLQQDQFLECRIQLESLFAQYQDSSQDIRREVQILSEEMRAELKLLVQEVSPAEYMEAQNFIRSLAYESQCRSQQG